MTCVSDASGSWGCGAFLPDHPSPSWFQLPCPNHWADEHIAAKEMVPVVVAAALWGRAWSNQRVHFRSDNSQVVAAILSGTSRHRTLAHLTRCLFFLAASFQFTSSASHIPGHLNCAADALSRNHLIKFCRLIPSAAPITSPIPTGVGARPQRMLDIPGLENTIRSLYGQGLAQSTSKAYASGKKRYLEFCRAAVVDPLPITERTACLFVGHLAEAGLQPASVKSYLAAIRHWQISAGLPDPVIMSSFPRLTYVLKGLQRVWATTHAPRHRLPITPHILSRLLTAWSAPPIDYDKRLM